MQPAGGGLQICFKMRVFSKKQAPSNEGAANVVKYLKTRD